MPSSIGSAMLARFSNRVMFLRKVSLTVPVGPLRFLATISSAMPGLVVGVVIFRAMEQEYQVCILLDRAGFAEVGHAWPAILAVLDGAVELREGR